MYDVIVVGAGPVGSYLSSQMAAKGYRVLLLEEHASIGKPVHCTGIIGSQSFEALDLPSQTILNSIDTIRFISPENHQVDLHHPQTWARIVCRRSFDQALAKHAEDSGVELRLNSRVSQIKSWDRYVEVIVGSSKDGLAKNIEEAKYVVLATGSMCNLPYKLGFYRPWYFLKSTQVEMDIQFEDSNRVEAFLGKSTSGGEFVWIAPVNDTRARIGLFSKNNSKELLQNFLNRSDIQNRLREEPKISHGVIPVGGLDYKKVSHERIFTVGDAAGQVKPTSAGGIVFGLNSSKILAQQLDSALREGHKGLSLARSYYRDVRKKLGFEIMIGDVFRRLFSRLDDEDWDELIQLANDPQLLKMIHERSIFDQHSKFIRWALTHKTYRKVFFKHGVPAMWPLLRQGARLWI